MIKYVIVNKSDLDAPDSTIDFSQLSYSDSSRLRYSLDGVRAVIQYETPLPSFFSGMTTYTISQIQEVLSGPEWTEVITEDDIL